MTLGCFPQFDSKAPLPKTIPAQLNKHGKAKLVLTKSLHTYILASLVQEGSLHATKREI